MARKLLLVAAVLTLLVSVSSITLSAEVPAAIGGQPAACAQPAAALPWLQPAPTPMQLGCSASYNCVHGTTVSCSSPLVGTCTSSGARCGVVTCQGQSTFCPGYCAGDHHCASFCGWDDPASYCDDYGCCVCSS
jgi:hypothetical protein